MPVPSLADVLRALPDRPDADELFDVFTGWAADAGTELYDHQQEAVIELFGGANVVLGTPTGSGKTLVATAALLAALADGRRAYYTAPIKALVSEKFFALCETFGAERVGMLTGDGAVNPGAPIVCATAEVLANLALRDGPVADVDAVVMDEFHFYADGQRGWAWQVPLLTLPHVQFLLMSATLGDVRAIAEDLSRRTGRETAIVDQAVRPVPLTFAWTTEPVHDLVGRLVAEDQAPVYLVHFTQRDATERAQAPLSAQVTTREERDRIAEELGAFRFTAGFGRTLSKLVRAGVGVHHAGMLPRYRRLVERLAQQGLLKVVCGTDTLGVGVNVPIRTVVFTGLAKYDGTRHRLLKAREFHQIAGRAGRAGFDTTGLVVVQAPEHVIERERAIAKAGDDPKKRRKVQTKKAPEGHVGWTEETFERLRDASPEALVSKLRVEHATILNVVQRPGDPVAAMHDLVTDNHEDERGRQRLEERARALGDELVAAGVLEWLDEPDPDGRTIALSADLQDDFALDHPLASFALAALDELDPASESYALDVVSVIEAVLADPGPLLSAQANRARADAVAAMKAEGIEYEERMLLLEEVGHPQPLGEGLRALLAEFRRTRPWVREEDLSPKSVVREMCEQGMTFSDLVREYGLARSEGLVLRYLSDAYRTLRRTVPDDRKTPELDDIVDWLGETVRQTDSSLLDEWEALTDPDGVREAAARAAVGEPAPPPRPVTGNERAFLRMLRNAMFRRVQLFARRDAVALADLEAAAAALTDPPTRPTMTFDAWEDALEAYFAEHDRVGDGPAARSPNLLLVDRDPARVEGRVWEIRQILDDPAEDHEFRIVAQVDLDASDAAGEPVVGVVRVDGSLL